ncbi:MAG: bifunctional serine/threonine-protein kinase/ABC transporter substrate-binding protein [Polyangiales bacterium]
MGAATTDDPKRAEPPLVPEGLVIDDGLTIRSLIGQGGMAQVFLAHQSGLERDVALKLMRPTRDRDRARFLLEARNLGRLKHRNAVSAFAAGCFEHEDRDYWYIAMELVVGATLKQRLKEDGALPVPVVLDIVEDVAGALQEAHELGIIHRDLKPSNVMIEDQGAGGNARVLDFGVAKLLGNTDNATSDNEVLGSPRYMSPEQFQHDDVDQRSDIYSLGLLMTEMLTGKHPLGKKVSLSDMMEWLQRPEIPTPGLDTFDPALAALVRRCLQRDPNARFPNMGALVEELQTLRAPAERPKSRRWLMVGVLTALIVAFAFAATMFRPAGPQDAPVMDTGEGETFVLLTPRTDTFWTSSAEFASAAAVGLGKRLVVYDAHNDGETMIRQARQAVESSPLGIISQDFIGHGQDIENVAAEQETPFFAINTHFDNGVPRSAVAALRPNDEATGYELARSLVDALRESAPGAERIQVVAVQGTEGEFATDSRRRGLERALSEHDDFDIAARVVSGFANQSEARDGVRQALQGSLLDASQPVVIWCATDTMALGAIQGTVQAGREPGSDVLIGGVDWTRDGLLAIQEGTLHVSFGGHFMEAGFAIILAEAGVERTDPFQLSSPMRPATRSNVDEVLSLFRTGGFERIDFHALVRQVRAGRAEDVLDPAAMLAAP